MSGPGELEILSLCRPNFAAFCVAMRPDFEVPPFLEILISNLEAIDRGEIQRLLVSCPPRHGKSLTSSVLFPAWYLGRNPRKFVVVAGHSEELAVTFGRAVRNIVASPIFQAIFPECRISGDSAAVHRFNLDAGGGFFAVGRGTSLTGRGGSLLVLDDLVKDRAEADSPAIRKSTEAWFREIALTRLEPRGSVVAIGTRWHESDILGTLVADVCSAERWRVLSLPAIAERDEGFRREGDALWPERYPLAELLRIKAEVGSRAWSALYQGRPSPQEGSIFKREWFSTFDQCPTEMLRAVQFWDTAFGKNQAGDFSVCATIGESKTGYHVLHVYRDRPDFPTLKRKMQELNAAWSPSAVLVEDAASGQSAIQELRAESNIPLIAVPVGGSDKIAKWNAVAPLFESGRVSFQAGAAWLPDVLEELASVPGAKHDDAADAIAGALTYLRGPRSAPRWGFASVQAYDGRRGGAFDNDEDTDTDRGGRVHGRFGRGGLYG